MSETPPSQANVTAVTAEEHSDILEALIKNRQESINDNNNAPSQANVTEDQLKVLETEIQASLGDIFNQIENFNNQEYYADRNGNDSAEYVREVQSETKEGANHLLSAMKSLEGFGRLMDQYQSYIMAKPGGDPDLQQRFQTFESNVLKANITKRPEFAGAKSFSDLLDLYQDHMAVGVNKVSSFLNTTKGNVNAIADAKDAEANLIAIQRVLGTISLATTAMSSGIGLLSSVTNIANGADLIRQADSAVKFVKDGSAATNLGLTQNASGSSSLSDLAKAAGFAPEQMINYAKGDGDLGKSIQSLSDAQYNFDVTVVKRVPELRDDLGVVVTDRDNETMEWVSRDEPTGSLADRFSSFYNKAETQIRDAHKTLEADPNVGLIPTHYYVADQVKWETQKWQWGSGDYDFDWEEVLVGSISLRAIRPLLSDQSLQDGREGISIGDVNIVDGP